MRATPGLAAQLSAHYLVGETDIDEEDGTFTFCLSDDDSLVEISHEFGDPEEAARRLSEVANALHLHAERIRGSARAEVSWT